MSSSSEQERLQDEINELRGELGETVEALVHKADIPARARERGTQLRDQAVERGVELRDRAGRRAEQARDAVGHTLTNRWVLLAGAGAVLLTAFVVARRIKAR